MKISAKVAALGTIALLMAGNVFADAPVLQGVPDVTISDSEDNVGATVDLNFFRYENAFDILAFTNDPDTPSSDMLTFAFYELPDNGSSDISINGQTQLPSGEETDLPENWSNVIPNENPASGQFNLSFLDLIRSPNGDAGTPYPDPLDASGTPVAEGTTELLPFHNDADSTVLGPGDELYREICLLVGDDAENVGSDTILVMSENNGADDVKAAFTTIFTDSTFTGDAVLGGWRWGLEGFPFEAATSSGGNSDGYIGLTSGADAGGSIVPLAAPYGVFFSRWIQRTPGLALGTPTGPITGVLDDGQVYAGRLTFALTAAASNDKDFAPHIRFGANNVFALVDTVISVNSINLTHDAATEDANPQLPDASASKDYVFMWAPVTGLPGASSLVNAESDGRTFALFMDIVDVDGAGTLGGTSDTGTWEMTNVEVGAVDDPAVDPSGTLYEDFTAATGNWRENPDFPANGVTINASTTGVEFVGATTGSNPDVGVYGTWQRPRSMPWEAGKVVRLTANLSVPDAASRDTFQQARIRTLIPQGNISTEFAISRRQLAADTFGTGTESYLMPEIAGTDYQTYIPSFGGPSPFIDTLLPTFPGAKEFVLGVDYLQVDAGATTFSCNSILAETLDLPVEE